MQIGFIGLGKMGLNMVRRILAVGHQVVGYDLSETQMEAARQLGAQTASSLEDLADQLQPPSIIWIMIPAGEPVSSTIQGLLPHLAEGDILIDGGNSRYKDSILRAEKLRKEEIEFLDIGTSGGLGGLQQGYCLMVGGSKTAFQEIEPILKALAAPEGYAWVGPSGAGHFVKMVHNGIEYGLMEAYAEGFELMEASPYDLDLSLIASLWNQGSVIRSWLLELAQRAFSKDPHLSDISGFIEDSGEGQWSVEEALDSHVPVPEMVLSLFTRYRSRQTDSFAAKVVASLRHEFGGHPVHSDESQGK